MKSARTILGSSIALARIQPPGRSFEEWDRFLEECREAGIAEFDEKTGQFAGPFGAALLRRWRWLRDARAQGLGYQEAETAFGRAVDRGRAEERQAMTTSERHRAAAFLEAAAAKRLQKRSRARAAEEGDDADAILEHAGALGL